MSRTAGPLFDYGNQQDARATRRSNPYTDPPLARRTDPMSSHEAADRAVENGTAESHEGRILKALRKPPGRLLTAKQIGAEIDLTNVQVHRRMKKLEGRGLVGRNEDDREVRFYAL